MKKLVLIFLALTLVTSCDNEPLDPAYTNGGEQNGGGNTGGGNTGGGDPNGGNFALSSYSYDKSVDSGFGVSTIETDFYLNSSGLIGSQSTRVELFGIIVDGTAPVVRDNNGRIIETSASDGTNEISTTTITYNGDNIVQINFVDNQYPEENYTYNLEHNDNIATRTEVGSSVIVTYTFDTNDRLIQRETSSEGTTVRNETLSYDANSNLTSTVMTGDGARTFTYTYDDNTNPLKDIFQDFYKLQLFNDNYDDQIEHWQAFWGSSNNMTSATTPEGSSDLEIVYDTEGRIINRSGSINSALLNAGSGDITIDEVFNYVN